MEVRVVPTPGLPITDLNLPTSDFSFENGLRILVEMKVESGMVIDRRYVEVDLPLFVINGEVVEAKSYLKSLVLASLNLEENSESPPDVEVIPIPDVQGFMNRLDVVELGGTGLFSALASNPGTAFVAWQSYQCLLNLKNAPQGQDMSLEYRTLNFLYLQMLSAMNASQVQDLRSAIADFHLPISV